MAHCEELLNEIANDPGRKLVITDGVFSMDGDIGPVTRLAALAEKYGAIMMVDDAHSSGVLGATAAAAVDHFGHARARRRAGGNAVKGHRGAGRLCLRIRSTLIDFLYHRARPFLFSTSHPPSVAATCMAAFDVLETGTRAHRPPLEQYPVLPGRAQARGLQHRRREYAGTETPITPVIVGEGRAAWTFRALSSTKA